jgi:mRNA-degrading endonuclease toxin of MazEF toxin-antitoxin module
MRTGAFLLLLLWTAAAQAQSTMYKCVDERRQLTYSNVPCEKQGLKTDGTVTADRVTTMPNTPTQGSGQLPTQRLKPPVEMPKDLEKNVK